MICLNFFYLSRASARETLEHRNSIIQQPRTGKVFSLPAVVLATVPVEQKAARKVSSPLT